MAKAPPQRLDPSLLNYVGKGLKDTYENITRERAVKDAFNASANATVFPGFEAYGVIRDLLYPLFLLYQFEFLYSSNYIDFTTRCLSCFTSLQMGVAAEDSKDNIQPVVLVGACSVHYSPPDLAFMFANTCAALLSSSFL